MPSAAEGAVRWQDIDLTALLKLFCARQQRHYLRELGEAATHRAGGSAALAVQEATAAAVEAQVASVFRRVQLHDQPVSPSLEVRAAVQPGAGTPADGEAAAAAAGRTDALGREGERATK